ncbi:hypothetical protein [Psychrobacter aquaticus]|uniref:Uncharacterized protein n=1 Tax=Psychrobacter aquaticus CMS 56 TaxID=1354303 RepID=U4T302_9GAMM|nr:hypothetical protein [Psychrobacter aquaticus]ERL54326.1 hypothetical protein M917_2831 [Psychrobacter aquaticus CMS 56]
MGKTTEQLVRIAAAGGGFYVSSSKTTEQLVRIAAAASTSGAKIVVKGASNKTTEQLVRIAAAGKGSVMFDLSE